MFFNFKVCLTTCFCKLKEIKAGSHEFFKGPKNCYRWFPLISGHGTEKLLSMRFEILGLVFTPFCFISFE